MVLVLKCWSGKGNRHIAEIYVENNSNYGIYLSWFLLPMSFLVPYALYIYLSYILSLITYLVPFLLVFPYFLVHPSVHYIAMQIFQLGFVNGGAEVLIHLTVMSMTVRPPSNRQKDIFYFLEFSCGLWSIKSFLLESCWSSGIVLFIFYSSLGVSIKFHDRSYWMYPSALQLKYW